jgi:hypothetical protein
MASTRKAPAASHDDGASSGSASRPSGGAASTAEVDYVLPDVQKRNPISQAIYTYNMWTGLYMLDPWEKFLFSEFPVGTGVLVRNAPATSQSKSATPANDSPPADSVVITIIIVALYYGWRFLGPKEQ